MKNKKLLITLISVAAVLAVAAAVLFIPITATAKEPIVIACISDPHHEYGVQDTESHVRPSSETAIEYIEKLTNGGADYVFCGGDITGRNGEWNDSTIKDTMKASFDLFSSASKDGKVMLVTGNHDPEPSVHSETEKINSNDYSEYMFEALGQPAAAFYTADLGLNPDFTGPFNELLGYRYTFGSLSFIGLNTPNGDRRAIKQTGQNGLYEEQVDWATKQVKELGPDHTVFLLCHYPAETLYTVELAETKLYKDDDNGARVKMLSLLENNDNIIYCYGHVHTETHEALTKTAELVSAVGESAENSSILCHMGSLGYYNDHYGGPLAEVDPQVIQVNMIYIHTDKIVFEIHNTGAKEAYGGNREIEKLEIKRDMSSALKTKESLFQKIFG